MISVGRPGPVALIILAAVAAALALAVIMPREANYDPLDDRYLVGAVYYAWYPENFRHGYLREKLNPPQQPVLGTYDSADVGVAEKHIEWASRYGVDFFAVNWWPRRPEQNRTVSDVFMKASNLDDIRFCVFYETWNLGFETDRGVTVFDEANTNKLVSDFIKIAGLMFGHPAYLKVDGRPVVFLYLARTFHGDYAAAIARLREELLQRGYDLFLVADEVFWGVVPADGFGRPVKNPEKVGHNPYLTPEPQMKRIRLFDAVTSYNMYEGGSEQFRGYGAQSAYVKEVNEKYGEYRTAIGAAGAQVALAPNVIPGYNDRGVRPRVDHFAIPRQWAEGAPEGSFFAESIDRIVFPNIDPELNMALVTSWNEWNEDTSIEPLRKSAPTVEDNTGPGRYFTQGYPYSGYGFTYLEVLRDKFIAVAGRVTDGGGGAVKGAEVCAWRGAVKAACDLTDSGGYYAISRLHAGEGVYRVEATGRGGGYEAAVEKSKTVIMDFPG